MNNTQHSENHRTSSKLPECIHTPGKTGSFGVQLNSIYEKELIFKVGVYCHSNLELMGDRMVTLTSVPALWLQHANVHSTVQSALWTENNMFSYCPYRMCIDMSPSRWGRSDWHMNKGRVRERLSGLSGFTLYKRNFSLAAAVFLGMH